MSVKFFCRFPLLVYWWSSVEPFSVLVDRVEKARVFCWNRKPLKVKVLSTVLYYSGLSYRVVARVLRDSAKFAHESVRLWFRRLKDAFQKPEQRRRRVVAVDETKLKVGGEQLFVRAAVDVKTKEVLACRVSWARNIMDAEALLRKVLEAYSNKPRTQMAKRNLWNAKPHRKMVRHPQSLYLYLSLPLRPMACSSLSYSLTKSVRNRTIKRNGNLRLFFR